MPNMGETEDCDRCWHEHMYHHNGGRCQVSGCKCRGFVDG